MTPEEQKEYEEHNRRQHEEMVSITNLLKRASVEGLLPEIVRTAMDNYLCKPEAGKVQAIADACYDWDV
jgi:hypothetical protein